MSSAEPRPPATRRLAVSDAHGHLEPLRERLVEHGVVDADQGWAAGALRVWFLGDYVDRGQQGLEVVALVRALERAAPAAGGALTPLLGNHELQFLAALHFGDAPEASVGATPWRTGWLRYGGVPEELASVDDPTVDWMTRLPLVARDGDELFVHSDTDGYLELGGSVEEINAAGHDILSSRDARAWAMLHRILTRRHAFREDDRLEAFLSRLGARRVVHGHTTLISGFGLSRDEARHPHVYAGGRAVAIDGGVFEGGVVVVAEL